MILERRGSIVSPSSNLILLSFQAIDLIPVHNEESNLGLEIFMQLMALARCWLGIWW